MTLRSPQVVGHVVDAQKKTPIANAKVSGAQHGAPYFPPGKKELRWTHNPVKPSTLTKADGTFRLGSTHNFLLTKVFFAPCSGSLGDQGGESIYVFMVTAEGYEPLIFANPREQEPSFDAGELRLKPLHTAP